jgi:phosphoribulokinase
MVLKKVLVGLPRAREFHKELEYLYARRAAIEALIRSMEGYIRFVPGTPPVTHLGRRRKTA